MNQGEVDLWLVPVRRRTGWLAILDDAERQRAAELAGTPAGDMFVTSRATQRLVGARYLGTPPAAIVTDRSCAHCDTGARHGRPRWRDASIDYSVSHTEDWVVMAVTGCGLVGVDIEEQATAPDPDGFARACLTAAERREFDALPLPARTSWLVSAWTRKEAAMKLTGLGLRAPPAQLDVSGDVVITAVSRWPATAVHLYGIDAPAGHLAALATTVPLRSVRSTTYADRQAPGRGAWIGGVGRVGLGGQRQVAHDRWPAPSVLALGAPGAGVSRDRPASPPRPWPARGR